MYRAKFIHNNAGDEISISEFNGLIDRTTTLFLSTAS